MNTKRFIPSSLGALAALALMAAPAFADSEIFSFNLAQTPLTISSTLDDSFNLPAFDPSLGTLTGVKLTINLNSTASPQIINLGGGAATYSNTSTSFFTTFTGPDGSSVSYNTVSGKLSGSLNTAQFVTTTVTGTPIDSSTSAFVGAANFASYEGTSPLGFSLMAPGDTAFSSAGTATTGSLGFGGSGAVGGTAIIEYDFSSTATPEPASWALGVICLALFGTLSFRMRRTLC